MCPKLLRLVWRIARDGFGGVLPQAFAQQLNETHTAVHGRPVSNRCNAQSGKREIDVRPAYRPIQ
jgi:hypothetical protein